MEGLDTILRQIDAVYQRVGNHKLNSDLLLQDASSLATLLYNLGDYWVMARQAADSAESAYRDAVDDRFLALLKGGEKQGKAEVQAKAENRELRDEGLTKRQMEVKLNTLRRDIERKISILQSFSAELRTRRAQEKL